MEFRLTITKVLCFLLLVYMLGAVVVFDFDTAAHSWHEEKHGGKLVAIGPCPRTWVPWAARAHDFPGGFDYSVNEWPFRLWKPLCLTYCEINGYALPSEWR